MRTLFVLLGLVRPTKVIREKFLLQSIPNGMNRKNFTAKKTFNSEVFRTLVEENFDWLIDSIEDRLYILDYICEKELREEEERRAIRWVDFTTNLL